MNIVTKTGYGIVSALFFFPLQALLFFLAATLFVINVSEQDAARIASQKQELTQLKIEEMATCEATELDEETAVFKCTRKD